MVVATSLKSTMEATNDGGTTQTKEDDGGRQRKKIMCSAYKQRRGGKVFNIQVKDIFVTSLKLLCAQTILLGAPNNG